MIIQILPCRAHGDWRFCDATVTHAEGGNGGIRVITELPLEPGEQFLLKARSPRVCIASYEVVSCRRDGKQCELHARFAGFVANPANLSAGQFATALAA